MERTFVMIKPDGVGRGLIGECLRRFERRGLKVVALKMQRLSVEQAHRQYGEHRDKPFFEPLVAFITSGPSVLLVLEGRDAIVQARKMNGATNCIEAEAGTIRGDLGLSNRKNLVHASDSAATAAREIALYFNDDEVIDYTLPYEDWLQ